MRRADHASRLKWLWVMSCWKNGSVSSMMDEELSVVRERPYYVYAIFSLHDDI